MKEQFTSITSRDFRQRYEGTYGFFTTESKQRILVHLATIGENSLTFTDAKRQSYQANADKGVEFEFLSPVKKLFSIDDTIYIIHRRLARQFQRGISEGNTIIRDVTSERNGAVNFKRLQAAFSDDQYPVRQRWVQYLTGKRETVLLSDMFAVVGDKLYLYKDIIGTFDKEQKKFKITVEFFREEVSDMVRDNKLDCTVEVAQ